MLTDGIAFLGSGTAENFNVENGTSLPSSDNTIGRLFYLTEGETGLYVYKDTGWTLVGEGAGGGGGEGGIGPDFRYDLSFANPGLMDPGYVFIMVAPRSYNLLSSGHRAIALTAPTDTTTLDVWKRTAAGVSSKIGTISWAPGQNAGTATITETAFAAGDTLSVQVTVPDITMQDISVTLMAHIL